MASAFQESHGKDAVGKSGKVKVTILASEWGSSNGGLSTLNRELAIWLAKSSDVEISFFVPQCSEKDKTEALRHNISIVEASPLIGFGKLELLSFPPDDLQIEVVVGHGVILGRQAQVIRRNRKCKWVQVMHTDSEEMGMFKSYPDPISRNEKKHNDEVGLCEKADFVVGIGPKLAEAFHSYLRFCKNDWTIFDFTPGIFEEFRSVQQVSKEVNHRSVLVFGRGDVEDFKLKGFDIAGKAISSLVDTILVFVGAPDGKHEEVKEFFTLSGLPGRRLRVREYTESREQLKKLFCEVDLVLMPSRTDGFGLTGLEALSAGLPVLVSKNSGFGEALCNVPHCSHFVIDSDNPDVWAAAIKNIIWDKNRQCRLEQAKKVRKSYHEKYSWTKQSDALRSKIVKLARACLQLQIDGVPIPKASAQKGTETEVHSSDRQVIQEVRVPSTTKKQEVLNKIMEMYLRNIDPLNSEQWNGFVCFLQEVHQLMILCADSGSLRITVEVCSKATLEELWKDYRSGHLNQVAQEFLVTEELLEEFGLIYFELTTFIAEGEYKTCQHYFSGNIASRRINADNIAIPLCLPNNCRWNAATGYYDKTGEQRRSLYVFESALRKLRTVKGNIASRRITANDIAIPLCLPNNCRWNAATGYYDKTGEQRRSLYVVEPALRKLRTVKGPVCVVSIAGQYRRGKSYILAEAFDQPDVFPLGHHFEPETMGIWMWIVPQKFQLSNGQECTVVLLDSEGIDTVVGEGLDDHQIFTLTVLLSSVMIYNSTGAPTRHDLDGLDFIVKLSERIKLRSSNDGKPSMRACRKDTEFFHKTFPFFMWLLRDVVKSIPPDCDNIKEYILTRVFKDQRQSVGDNAQKVAESILRFFPGFQAFSLRPPSDDEELLRNMNSNKSRLNPRFLSGLKQFKQLLRSVLIPKYSPNDGEIVTGEGLAALVQLYVDAINTPGVIPNVQTAWETFVMTKCSEACQASLKLYDATMNAELSGKLPCDSDFIRVKHELALQKGVALLEKETFGISATTTEKYWKKLTGSFDEKLGWWQLENGKLTRAACDSLLKKLKKKHLDPVLARLGKEGAKMSFDDIQQGYKRIEQDFKASAKGAKDVCAEVFYEFHPLLMEEMKQYFGVLQQLKDFDEKKSLEMAARAYQEQEMKKLEEKHARLEQENREHQKDMEKQQSKFEEERKRLQEQRAEDAKVQQEQMENMIKASMQRAEQDRKEFTRENQGLNARLEEMKRLDQERQMEIARLNQQIHQNMSQQQEARKPGFFDKALQMVTGVSSLIAAGAGLAAAVPKCNVM